MELKLSIGNKVSVKRLLESQRLWMEGTIIAIHAKVKGGFAYSILIDGQKKTSFFEGIEDVKLIGKTKAKSVKSKINKVPKVGSLITINNISKLVENVLYTVEMVEGFDPISWFSLSGEKVRRNSKSI